jgi:hypothetical protein
MMDNLEQKLKVAHAMTLCMLEDFACLGIRADNHSALFPSLLNVLVTCEAIDCVFARACS